MEQYVWCLETIEKFKALQLSDFFFLFLAMSGVKGHAGVLKCIHQVAMDADSGNNGYTRFVMDYFHSMSGYLHCLQSDLEVLEGLFWYFNHAASFSSPEIAEDRVDLLIAVWEGLTMETWADFSGQPHYEREYPLNFLSFGPLC